jgi:AraC-like DNA-binding protein
MYDRNAVRLAIVHMLPRVASAVDARVEPLLQGVGILEPQVEWYHRVVARAQVCALLRGLARASGEALIGFHLGPAAEPQRLGPSGAALFAGATLRDCLALHARHMPDLQCGVAMAVIERGGQAHWIHRTRDSDPEMAAHLTEGIAAFVAKAIRAIVGDPDAGLMVTFPHRPLASMARYEDALGCAVAFRSGRDLDIAFDAALLDRRNVLQRIAIPSPDDQRGGGTLAEPGAADESELLEVLRAIIGAAALAGPPSLRQAALTLGLSPRSLQRRLAGMGATWEVLVDEWRCETAMAKLGDPANRVGAVARSLGYSDPAHFDRAFRRWTGDTPTLFRKGLVGESPLAG